jgi:4-amino-4-deoxy-L-arabinose transferase-like glycosyltransferase
MVGNIERQTPRKKRILEKPVGARYFWPTLIAIILAAALKFWLLFKDAIPFNADEAIVALMARHILNGERPFFFYGQAYMGSLDAWLAAAGFLIFGAHVWVIRLIQSLLYLLVLITTAWLGRLVFRSWKQGVVAVWLLAIPTVNVTLYTTASLGGYGETLLIGNLILIMGLTILERIDKGCKSLIILWLALGGLIGVGFWINGLILIYALPMLFYMGLWVRRLIQTKSGLIFRMKDLVRPVGMLTLGILIGAIPWWLYALREGNSSPILDLSNSVIHGVNGLSWASQVGSHFINLILFGLTVIIGVRPPWSITSYALPIVPIIVSFWIAVIIYTLKRMSKPALGNHHGLIFGVLIAMLLGFIFTRFGADPTGRYFLPLAVPMALLAGDMVIALSIRIGNWAWVLAGIIIVYNLFGTFQSANLVPPGITTQLDPATQIDQRNIPNLITFLHNQDEMYGYTNYWVSYPLAFLSEERMLFLPALPYNQDFRYTARDNRYQPYNGGVAGADKVAYITTHHPALDKYIRVQFRQAGVSWDEAKIGDFQVFYGLSKLIRPEEIGLGVTTP